MKIEEGTFYVAQFPESSYVFADQSDAVDKLRENSDKLDEDANGFSVVEVDFSDDDWSVMEIPWQRIAVQLLREE